MNRFISTFSAEGFPLYIIDGYNVVFNGSLFTGRKSGRGELDSLDSIEGMRNHFLALLSSYAARKKVSMTVVWDGGYGMGGGRHLTRGGVRSIYTHTGLSADERIIRMVEQESNRRRITVVSDDRRHITGIVRNLGAQSMGVRKFLLLIGLPHHRGKKGREGHDASREAEISAVKGRADDLSVDEWLKLFGSRK